MTTDTRPDTAKAVYPMVAMEVGRDTWERLVQYRKAEAPSEVTEVGITTARSGVLLKVEFSMTCTEVGMVTACRERLRDKRESPKTDTLLGMATDTTPVPRKASLGSTASDVGREMLDRAPHNRKACSPRNVTDVGMLIECSPHPWNALGAMDCSEVGRASSTRLAVLAKEPSWMVRRDVGRETDSKDLQLLNADLDIDVTDVGIVIETNPVDENTLWGIDLIEVGMDTVVRELQ